MINAVDKKWCRRLGSLMAALTAGLLVPGTATASTAIASTAMGSAAKHAAGRAFTGRAAPPAPRPAARPGQSQFTDHSIGSQIRRYEQPWAETGAGTPNLNGTVAGAKKVLRGIDVSGHQRTVNWNYWWRRGKRFVWVKATEGTSYRNPYFTQQYNGSYRRGFVRGAYHFALPSNSSGAAQARYFSSHGGGWSADGKTLPGVIDMEYNPYGQTCYGKSKKAMAKWVMDFARTYHAKWKRWPAIYTSTSWWNTCVGNHSGKIGKLIPLWIVRYAPRGPGKLPNGWRSWRFWQYSSNPIDQNLYRGSRAKLVKFATRRN